MRVEDYVIDHQDFDWPVILADWAWLLPRDEFTIWLMNRYGDLFLVFEDDTVHMLDVGGGSLEKLAETRDEFCRRLDEDDNANVWLMIPLVDSLVEAEKILEPGRCYSFIIPPVLGGEYTVGNTATLPITEHYGVYASIHNQIKDLPDGARVRLRAKA
ncbi:MAG: DUF1851 domain-containing protein [Acidobacteriota bacterium]|nr:DUF1851 domain-containing protein [Acidobacteriota bacterium]